MGLKLIWDEEAVAGLREAYNYIKLDSEQTATRVVTEILDCIEDLKSFPQLYPTDRFKINNPGNYRAFEKHRYRIAYTILDREIQILRVRHTSREPLEY